jgi:hypothetical protein
MNSQLLDIPEHCRMRCWAACYGTTRAPSKATLAMAQSECWNPLPSDRASRHTCCAVCSKLALFVAEAAFSQVGDTHDHASFRIEWQVFEIEAAVEVSHRLVERVSENAKTSDLGGKPNRSSKCKEEQ